MAADTPREWIDLGELPKDSRMEIQPPPEPEIRGHTGAGDRFRTRHIASPPLPDLDIRSVSPYLADRPTNLNQHVYVWSQEVLRWREANRQFGSNNPLQWPGLLSVPDEYAWVIANRDRVSIDEARARANAQVVAELTRIIQSTDAPPHDWALSLHLARRRGPAPPGSSWWRKILHKIGR